MLPIGWSQSLRNFIGIEGVAMVRPTLVTTWSYFRSLFFLRCFLLAQFCIPGARSSH